MAVTRLSGDMAADFARRHGVPRCYDDADEMIAALLTAYRARANLSA